MSKLILLKWLEMCFLLNNWFLSGNNQSCSYNAHLHILIMNLLQFKFQFSLLVMLFTVRGPRSQFFPDDSALDTVTRRDCPSGWVRKMGDLVAHIWPVLGLAVAHDHWPLAVIYSDGDYILQEVLISVIEKFFEFLVFPTVQLSWVLRPLLHPVLATLGPLDAVIFTLPNATTL